MGVSRTQLGTFPPQSISSFSQTKLWSGLGRSNSKSKRASRHHVGTLRSLRKLTRIVYGEECPSDDSTDSNNSRSASETEGSDSEAEGGNAPRFLSTSSTQLHGFPGSMDPSPPVILLSQSKTSIALVRTYCRRKRFYSAKSARQLFKRLASIRRHNRRKGGRLFPRSLSSSAVGNTSSLMAAQSPSIVVLIDDLERPIPTPDVVRVLQELDKGTTRCVRLSGNSVSASPVSGFIEVPAPWSRSDILSAIEC